MKIQVITKPNARHEKVEKLDSNTYVVRVNAKPHDGEANSAVIEALADYFRVPKGRIKILAGKKARKKLVEIESF